MNGNAIRCDQCGHVEFQKQRPYYTGGSISNTPQIGGGVPVTVTTPYNVSWTEAYQGSKTPDYESRWLTLSLDITNTNFKHFCSKACLINYATECL